MQTISDEVLKILQSKADDGDVTAKRLLMIYQKYLDEEAAEKNRAYHLFEPWPYQEEFFKSDRTRILVVAGNGTGKTRCLYRKVAGVALGYDNHGGKIKQNCRVLLVGHDWEQIGKVAFKVLLKKGAFDICRVCGKGQKACERSGNCGDPGAQAFKKRSEEAPAFIPHECVQWESIQWLRKKNDWPLSVPVTNIHGGTSWLDFKPALSDEVGLQGREYDAIFVDEYLPGEGVKHELLGRLRASNGPFIHVGTALESGVAMLEDYEQFNRGSKNHAFFRWSTRDNRSLDPEYVEQFAKDLTEEMRRVRIDGEFLVLQGLIFNEVTPEHHKCEPFTGWETWTRYLAIDPGWNHSCGLLEIAVAPAGFVITSNGKTRITREGDKFIVWEFKQPGVPLEMLAKLIKSRDEIGHGIFRRIIDPASEQVTQASRVSFRTQLTTTYGISTILPPMGPEERMHINIIFGLVKPALRVRDDGWPTLACFTTCVEWDREVKRYRWMKDPTSRHGHSPHKKEDELMDCMQYIIASKPRHVSPEARALDVPQKHPLGEEYKRSIDELLQERELEDAKYSQYGG